jgi:hypothetical protein
MAGRVVELLGLARYRRQINQTAPAPARSQQPAHRLRHPYFFLRGCLHAQAFWTRSPPIESTAGGCFVDSNRRSTPPSLNEVLSDVQEHVAQCIAHLPRRSEQLNVVAAGDHFAFPPKHPVHRSRKAHRNRHHASRQRPLRLSLHDQVKMIVLNGVMHQSEVATLTTQSEGSSHFHHE